MLDEIPDLPSHAHSTAPPMPSSADIANMLVRQKMQQELQNTREGILQREQAHLQEVAKLNKMLEEMKLERKNDRNHLQQKISMLQKVKRMELTVYNSCTLDIVSEGIGIEEALTMWQNRILC